MAKQRKPTGVSSEDGFLDNVKQKEIDNKTRKADAETQEPQELNSGKSKPVTANR